MAVFMLVGFCFPLVAIPIVYAICAIIRRTLKLPKCCPLTIIDIAVPFAVVAIWNAVYESMVPAKSLANISEMFYLGLLYDGLLALRLWRLRSDVGLKWRDAIISFVFMCVLSAFFCIAFPPLPE